MKTISKIYLDYAAATPMDDEAVSAMQPFLKNDFYNPSSAYQAARVVHQKLEDFRLLVAQQLGAKKQEIIFTAGGTEANNLAIHGIMKQFSDANIITSSVEHDSVLEPAKQYDHRLISVDRHGQIDLKQLEQQIDKKTVLISIQYANNEIGTIQNIRAIHELIKNKLENRIESGNSLPLYFHTDACQAANYLSLSVSRLGVDLMTLNGGKIYASKQSGCLYIRSGVKVKPQIIGGGQEDSLRSGTENIAAIATFATMLQKVQLERKNETNRVVELRDRLFAAISSNYGSIVRNTPLKRCLPNNLNILIPGADGERLLMELDEHGLMASTGSACSASSDLPSHVLLAIGLSEQEASASLRFTLGRLTNKSQVDIAAKVINKVISS